MLGRLITLSCLVGAANGLFFHIKQGEVKCFVEEVPDETLVSGKTVPLFFQYQCGPRAKPLRRSAFSSSSV